MRLVEDRRSIMLAEGLILLLLATACVGSTPTPTSPASVEPYGSQEPASATDYDSLVAVLLAAGLAVEETEKEGKTQLYFISAPAQHLLVNGAKVLVFEYSDSALADADAAGVSSDGGTINTTGNGDKSTMMISWISAPHFYKSGRIIALYVGIIASINEALETAMGPQFAGS